MSARLRHLYFTGIFFLYRYLLNDIECIEADDHRVDNLSMAAMYSVILSVE